jgi:hypothetical protein
MFITFDLRHNISLLLYESNKSLTVFDRVIYMHPLHFFYMSQNGLYWIRELGSIKKSVQSTIFSKSDDPNLLTAGSHTHTTHNNPTNPSLEFLKNYNFQFLFY